jgi:hypothetical protein
VPTAFEHFQKSLDEHGFVVDYKSRMQTKVGSVITSLIRLPALAGRERNRFSGALRQRLNAPENRVEIQTPLRVI